MFTKSLGRIDQILRIIIGVILLSLTIIESKTPWDYIGLILILTSFINFCPIYRVLGLRTNSKK